MSHPIHFGDVLPSHSLGLVLKGGKLYFRHQTHHINHTALISFDAPILLNGKERKSIYIAPFILRIVSKHSDMNHAVLPANYTMPAFPSYQMVPPLT